MNKRQIDNIFMNFFDTYYILEYSGMEIEDRYMKITQKEQDEALKRIMTKIESDDEIYEYFSSKKYNSKFLNVYLNLMCYSSRVEDIKKLIEDRDILQIYIRQLIDLIKATGEKDYIKDCIENRSEELGLNEWDIIELMKAMGSEYVEYYIDTKSAELEFSSEALIELIKLTRKEYIENCIDNRMEEFGLNDEETYKTGLMELIRFASQEYIEKTIDNKRDILGLSHEELIIIMNLTSKKYLQNCIENRREELDLSHRDILNLIMATNDEEYIGSCIEKKREELDLQNEDIIELISTAKTRKCARNYIDRFYQGLKLNGKLTSTMNVPDNMTTGIEIESEGKNSWFIQSRISYMMCEDWDFKR